MQESGKLKLSRRQQQIMDVIYRLGEASVGEIRQELPEPPTSGATRRMLNVLVAKGAITARQDGARKVYRSRIATRVAREHALKRVIDTFFSGSIASTMAALLTSSDLRLSNAERETLAELIEKARERGH